MPTRHTNAEMIARWSAAYPRMAPFGPHGDFAREHLLNPTILRMLGDVRGQHIVDAGCDGGYLARLLVSRGARVTGVEPAAALYAEALAAEEAQPLGITDLQHDLATLAEAPHAAVLPSQRDAVVANMVLMDIPDYVPAMRAYIQALTGSQQAHLIAIGCSPVPDGHDHWTLRLLAVKAVELGFVEHIAPETIRAILRRTSSSRGNISSGVSRR